MSHIDRATQGTEKPTRRRCVACSHHHHSAAHSPSSHPKSSPTTTTSTKTKKTTPTAMASRFIVPDSSPPGSPTPSMPDQTPLRNSGFPTFGDLPSTTPAGPPPPSSVASFTPAGAPSDSYLGSSIMRSMAGQPTPNFGGGLSRDSTRTNLFGRSEKSNAPLGRSIGPRGRPASGLSRQFNMGDFEPDEDLDEDAEGEDDIQPPQGSLFRSSFAQKHFANKEVEDEIERAITRDLDLEEDNYDDEEEEEEEEEEDEDQEDQYEEQESEEDVSEDADASGDEADMFLNMRHDDRPYGQPVIGEESDLMMLNTPAATNRVRKEAESLYRQSTALLGSSGRKQGFEFATIARDFYTQFDIARLVEPSSLILETESAICRLYDEGVGTSEDEERLDDSLANATFRLVTLWNEFAAGLPKEGERLAYVGPGPSDSSFEKAAYVAHLILRLHHTRFLGDGAGDQKIPPVPEALLDWLRTSHNLYPDQARNVRYYQPSPAAHSLFWQTVRNSLLRGELADAIDLLRNAGWEAVTRGPRREPAYTGKALDNVKRFVASCCETLELCPATKSDWDIKNSSWTLFRIQARGARDKMTVFAEGTDHFRNSEDDQAAAPTGLSMSTMARKSTSQLPWDIYENLQAVYGIVLGNNEAIIDTAQDWCEATVGMFAWWDEKSDQQNAMRFSQQRDLLASTFRPNDLEGYFDRLTSTFHYVLQSDLVPNAMNPVEVAIASVFEGNVEAVIGFLRAWSLPVACSVAEVASLGRWLPISEVKKPLLMDNFDMEDLEILNIPQPTLDDIQGVKDSTLEAYARQLAGIEHLSPQREGWELAIQVLGRMDATEKSEATVGELLRDILKTLDENSSSTVDKMWRILNELGLINFAEETAETFADILSQESHRFGEALWYYALSHRTDRVREVLNLLISYSLIQSTVYPAEKDLDVELKNLLRKRGETLERRAEQDLEAAQLLGRMLSGYATLRKFYELRDELQAGGLPSSKALALKKQAAFALVAVVSSSDDNIRGGLYDDARDAVVSEDFLLALLGEASVFIHQSPTVITLEQIDILLKAVEDIQTVGSRVYSACEEFFDLVLSSGQGLKGSKPSDLMQKSTMSLGGSYVMSGSSMLTSHFHKSVAAGATIQRGWDWRKEFTVATKAEDVLRKLRLGLAKDLATLWLDDADGTAAW